MDMIRVNIPDIGDFDEVEVIEVLINIGDTVCIEDPIITLESDKATMEIPSPANGTVSSIAIAVGDKVSEGTMVAEIVDDQSPLETKAEAVTEDQNQTEAAIEAHRTEMMAGPDQTDTTTGADQVETKAGADQTEAAIETHRTEMMAGPGQTAALPHASPGVRRFARELGADLNLITGSGPKGRILKEDVKSRVKQLLLEMVSAPRQGVSGIPAIPEIDFSEFGDIENIRLTRIKRLSGPHLQRAWLNIPHVTHHDKADITELEEFRQSLKKETENEGLRITLLPFVMKALTGTLKKYPGFNASLAPGGETLILKRYYNIGIAIDTPDSTLR